MKNLSVLQQHDALSQDVERIQYHLEEMISGRAKLLDEVMLFAELCRQWALEILPLHSFQEGDRRYQLREFRFSDRQYPTVFVAKIDLAGDGDVEVFWPDRFFSLHRDMTDLRDQYFEIVSRHKHIYWRLEGSNRRWIRREDL